MDVIRKHDDRIDTERVACLGPSSGLTEPINLVSEEAAPAIEQIGGEEPASSDDEGAAIVRHAWTLRHDQDAVQRLRRAD